MSTWCWNLILHHFESIEHWFNQKLAGRSRFLNFMHLVSQKVTFCCQTTPLFENCWLSSRIGLFELHKSIFISYTYMMRYWNMSITNRSPNNEVIVRKTYAVNVVLSLSRSCLPRIKMLNNLNYNVRMMLKLNPPLFWEQGALV